MTPSTPPRARAPEYATPRTPANNVYLATPATKRAERASVTPKTKRPMLPLLLQTLQLALSTNWVLPATPEFTPARLPRRKRRCDAIAPSECAFGLFLPAPSTVGLGRRPKAREADAFFAPIAHDELLTTSVVRHTNLEQHPVDYECVESLPTRRKDTPRLPHTPELPHTPKLPRTPAAQLISEEVVLRWHGKSFNSDVSTDDEGRDRIGASAVENPFVSPRRPPKRGAPARAPERSPERSPECAPECAPKCASHMEMLNHRTGERTWVPLLPQQAAIKPKRLDFEWV
jgi:hypothetical protein